MEDLRVVFCGGSGNLGVGENPSSSSLVFQPTSCINHALMICFNVSLLIMLLFTSIQKSSSPPKIDDILPRFRGYSGMQIVSAIFNGCIGFVYLCSGIWILEEKLRKNQTALPLKSWLVVLFQGFTWLLVGLTISLRGKHLQRTLLRLLSILAFLFAGIVCALSKYSVILGKVISIKIALDVLSFPGAILLLLCVYKLGGDGSTGARAILRGSRMSEQDEATSSIDNATDLILQKTIQTEFSNRTVITATHRRPPVMIARWYFPLAERKHYDAGSKEKGSRARHG